MIDTETLRKKIIDLAIQGKLTQQLPEDGNAEDLYVQIQEERAKLITEGKIKQEKPLPRISDVEIPFEIPSNWKWTRIGDVTYSHGQKVPQNTFCYVDIGTLDNVNHKLNDKENIVEAKDAPSRARKIIEDGDVIYSTVRPYLHNICIIDKSFSYEPIASTAFAIMHAFDGCLLNKFLFIWLLSEWFDKYANGGNSKGVLYPAIGEKAFFNGLLPMPPFKEQERIVTIVDEIFNQIEYIDSFQKRYESDREILKGKIIDAAMRGKLTDHLIEDGDVEELYAQIRKEKAKLIKEGKLKNEKTLPDIFDVEIPYEIPNNWKWVRIGNVINEVIVPQRDKPTFSGDIPWCRIEDKEGNYLNGTKSGQFVSKETVEKMNLRICPVGTVLSACSGASIGTILITTVECCTNQTFNGLVCNSRLYNWYLFWYLKSVISKLKGMGTGSAMAYISQDKIRRMVIPLPPYEEQIRIVNTINIFMQTINYEENKKSVFE